MSTYSVGTDMNLQTISDIEDQLIVNQQKYYYFDIDDIDRFEVYVKDIDSALIGNAGMKLAELVDSYVLNMGCWDASVRAGNISGSDYTLTGLADSIYCNVTAAGSVTVVSSGPTTNTATKYGLGFQSSMVGKGFKVIDGTTSMSTQWYKILAVTTSLTCSITDWDRDVKVTSIADGAHGGNAHGFKVNAGFGVGRVDVGTIYNQILGAKRSLDQAGCSSTGRKMVVPAEIGMLILNGTSLTPAVAAAFEDRVTKGLLGEVAGFTIYQNEQTSGTSSAYKCWFGTTDHITFAMAMTQSEVERIPKQFGNAYKGLWVYGAKVPTLRKQCGGYMWVYAT
jgi:hypothetical protein